MEKKEKAILCPSMFVGVRVSLWKHVCMNPVNSSHNTAVLLALGFISGPVNVTSGPEDQKKDLKTHWKTQIDSENVSCSTIKQPPK